MESMSVSLNTKVSYGNFTSHLDMCKDNTCSTTYQPEDFPVDVKVGDQVYIRASVDTVNGLDLLAEDCYATPSSDPKDSINYPLIDDG